MPRWRRCPSTRGSGTALQTGYRYAHERGFEYFAHLDADGQHPPMELGKILEPVWAGGPDLVVGSRFVRDAEGQSSEFRSSTLRRIWIFAAGEAAERGLGPALHRHHQRLSRRQPAARSTSSRDLYQPDFGEIEALQTALTEGLTVKEVPVVMIERETGTSYLTAFHSFMFMFKSMILIAVGRFRRKR